VKNINEYIRICDELAFKAKEKGNAPVGCIIVKGDEIVARAEEAGKSKQDVTCHAEMEAIRMVRKQMGTDMSACTLISTHEPCVMCAYAIRYHRISKVVYQYNVKHLGSISSSMKILTTTEVPDHWGKSPQITQFKNI